MYRNYIKLAGMLYGDDQADPATTVAPMVRSSRHGQKNGLKRDVEGGIQARLASWLRESRIPFFSIPNEGNRGRIATHRLKVMGLWPGASDLFIARQVGAQGGFFVELKSPGQRPRPNQVAFMEAMRAEGYRADWFDSLEEARQSIVDYLAGKT